MPKSDWDIFRQDAIWSPPRKAKLQVGEAAAPPEPPDDLRPLFPRLCELIGRSRVTPVRINGKPHRLLVWDGRDGVTLGWFGPAEADGFAPVHEDHRALASFFPGIIERFNEPPETWLLNQNRVLTLDLAAEPLDIGNYLEDSGAGPIDLREWYVIAEEANGNKTICHRDNGEVLMFAHDHSFDHVVPLEGCPPYTLYRIRGAPTFTSWVEKVAKQWLDVVKL